MSDSGRLIMSLRSQLGSVDFAYYHRPRISRSPRQVVYFLGQPNVSLE